MNGAPCSNRGAQSEWLNQRCSLRSAHYSIRKASLDGYDYYCSDLNEMHTHTFVVTIRDDYNYRCWIKSSFKYGV